MASGAVGPRDPAMDETCAICGRDVPYRLTTHVLVNPGPDDGVADYFVCRSCYDDAVAPLFE